MKGKDILGNVFGILLCLILLAIGFGLLALLFAALPLLVVVAPLTIALVAGFLLIAYLRQRRRRK